MVTFWHLDLVTLGTALATLTGAALCLLARWHNWGLPVGDDEWSPARVVLERYADPTRWRRRVTRRRSRP
jgi:hypothetical protein